MSEPAQPNILNIFRAYDVRGITPLELNAKVAYKVAHAYFAITPGERFVIGHDMRETSMSLFYAFVRAAKDLGKVIETLGMITTDTMYFAVGKYEYDGGIMITASHNPKQWNGIKMVKKDVHVVDMSALKSHFEHMEVTVPEDVGKECECDHKDFSADYVNHVLSFIEKDKIRPLKVVADVGNGTAGKTLLNVFSALPQIELIDMYFEPNADFPHHEANPAVAANTTELSEAVLKHGADLGFAFDGDGDRCFFVDEKGEYLPAHYAAALFARFFLARNPGGKIVYDIRNVMALDYEVTNNGGEAIKVKAGHTFFKTTMQELGALFGAESSGHFYFRNNYFVDNGIIPALLMLQIVSQAEGPLSNLLELYRGEFFSSGEQNFSLKKDVAPEQVYQAFRDRFHGEKENDIDGITMVFDGWRFNARPSNTEPKLRINIEANSKRQLNKAVVEIHEVMAEYSDTNNARSSEQKFDELIHNLWFSWNHHHIFPFSDLFGDTWRKNPPPGEYKSGFGKKWFEDLLEMNEWKIDQSLRLMHNYLDEQDTWFGKRATKELASDYRILHKNPVAYFSMEYGLIDWLQIYSGGLGVLSGDFLKESSDMGIPMIATGIFYHQGYFHQDIDDHGYQRETYLSQNPEDYPVELITDKDGNQLEVSIEIVDHEVWVRAWRLHVGRNDLILLDTNFDKNSYEEDRMISAHLYGGGPDTRVRQEILLGIGGPRMLRAIGYEPSLYHMNEGHSGFLVLEIARRYIEEQGMSFDDAIKMVDDHLVFTNHTLKQAGNDIFPYSLMEHYFSTYLDNLKTSLHQVFELGKDQLYAQGQFSMTLLGLRNAKISNAVSKLHGKAAKKLWPDYNLIPITNGVHMPTWVAPEIHQLLDKYVGENWHFPEYKSDFTKVKNIPDKELWEAHLVRKRRLIDSINDELSMKLNPDALTIAWARRLASYKRPDLITHDLDKLEQAVNQTDRPVQILLAGKAHPQDTMGKQMLQAMCSRFQEPRFKGKVVIVPGYNWQLARRMVSGADIWLNTPFRYEEASGTSGMKAAANGVLQFTTLDGWTDEIDWSGKGWVIDENESAKSMYTVLLEKILPTFYEVTEQGFNPQWLQMMKASMCAVLYNYSTTRMMEEYLEKVYLPILLESSQFDTSKKID